MGFQKVLSTFQEENLLITVFVDFIVVSMIHDKLLRLVHLYLQSSKRSAMLSVVIRSVKFIGCCSYSMSSTSISSRSTSSSALFPLRFGRYLVEVVIACR